MPKSRGRLSRMPFWFVALPAVALVLAVLSPPGVARAAQSVAVSFDAAPPNANQPITTEYQASSFVYFQASDGYRPYRRSAAGTARSGSFVADAGSSACFADFPSNEGCGFSSPAIIGRLTRTASALTVYAGLFSVAPGPVSARLTAYRANGTTAGVSTDVAVSTAGFTTAVTVTSAAPDIEHFRLEAVGVNSTGATLGFDDLTLDFPDNSLPDVSVSAPTQINDLQQGGTLDIPVTIGRLNSSNGPLAMSVSGLPASVSGTFVTNPVPGTGTSTVLHLSATGNAAASENLVDVTISADPQGSAAVAPAVRSTTTPLRVREKFKVVATTGATSVAVPPCGTTDVGLQVVRNATFQGTVTLAVQSPGLTNEILPSASVPPESGLSVARTLRLKRSPSFTQGSTVQVTGSSPGAPTKYLLLTALAGQDSATVATPQGTTPRAFKPGSTVRLDSAGGFCPGSKVRVGNANAETSAVVAPDGHSLTFVVPRLATSGAVVIVRPDTTTYATSNTLTVSSVRNTDGFAFGNYPYGWLSYDELTSLVGSDEMFIHINPCWPWTSCPVNTGIPDPVAYLVWGAITIALHESGGHCFGFSRTVQEIKAGKVSLSLLEPGATKIFDPAYAAGPGAALSRWLDGRHAGQFTTQFLSAYLDRDTSVSAQLDRINSELSAGRYPGVTLHKSLTEGHVVTAYDMEAQPDGSTLVYVYDNNHPFDPAEITDGAKHKTAEADLSVIWVNKTKTLWSFKINGTTTWTGGGDDIFAIPLSTIPDNPSLPDLSSLLNVTIFGSAGGAAKVAGVPAGAEYLPALDSHAVPGAAGTIVSHASAGPVTHDVVGAAKGTYTETVMGGGFAASVNGVSTAPGVRDRISGDAKTGTLAFAAGRTRTLRIDAAQQLRGSARSVSLTTTSGRGGRDVLSFAGGKALSFRHAGPATTVRFTLSSVTPTGVVRFDSGPVPVPRGGRVTAVPRSWGSLTGVRLATTTAAGKTTTRVLANRARTSTRLAVGRATLTRSGRTVSSKVRVTVVRPVAGSVAGVVVRVLRGSKLVARQTVTLRSPGRTRVLSLRLPRLAKGSYRVVVNATLFLPGAAAATLRASSQAAVRLR